MHLSWGRSLSITLLALALLTADGCRARAPVAGDEVEPFKQSEPEQYAATIVCTVGDGPARELGVTRVARSGEMRREEWSEQGGARALISRPDMGKAFLLDLDNQMYVELVLNSEAPRVPEIRPSEESTARDGESSISPESLEHAFGDAPSPARVEWRALADRTIENHPCKVFEQRAIFDNGHVEINRLFRAGDLNDLIIRSEMESEGGPKVITERRDVKMAVSPDEFVVPPGFKKVDRLAH